MKPLEIEKLYAQAQLKFSCKSLGVRAVALMLAVSGGVATAQETTATVETTESVTSTESLAPLAVMTPEPGPAATAVSADAAATQTIVLVGEKVSLQNPNSAKGPFPDLVALTKSTVGGRVVDLTTHGLTMEATANMIGKAVIQKPDVVIMFTGFTDEKTETADDVQRAALTKTVKALEKSKTRVFLVPAATSVGAMTSANLMLVATELGVNFVPIGTEVGGQPFIDALASVNEALAPDTEAPVAVPPSRPATAVTVQGRRIADPNAAEEPAVNYDKSKANIQKELDRIAGESGEAAILPSLEDTKITTESLFSADAGSTIPEGGTLTKRGKEAQESINMRPLPAVKAFRPSIPVPRNETQTKEPGLSR